MNGAPQIPPLKSPVVDLLEQVLATAKNGQVDTIGIVSVDRLGATTTMFAGQRQGDLSNGIDMLKARILFGIMGINLDRLRAPSSGLVRPAMLG